MPSMPEVVIYTDGACSGNPGPGGYGVVLLFGDRRKELCGGFRRTTNNRMEMMAVLVGLRALKHPCRVALYSDSRYVVQAIAEGWALRWRRNGWMRDRTSRAKNVDLWQAILVELERHRVDARWVRGHAGDVENERCDRLAVAALAGDDLPLDSGYEG